MDFDDHVVDGEIDVSRKTKKIVSRVDKIFALVSYICLVFLLRKIESILGPSTF